MSEKYPRRVKHSGVAFEFGDETIVVPPLTAGQVENLTPALIAHDAIKVESFTQINERIQARIPIIWEALKRNYPDITKEDVVEFVNTDNSDRALQAVLGVDRTSPKIRELGEKLPVSV